MFRFGAHFGSALRDTTSPFPRRPLSSNLQVEEFTMDAEYNLDNLFNFREWSSQNTSQRPDDGTNSPTGASLLPDSITVSTTTSSTPLASSQCSVLRSRLTFLQEEDWDPTTRYDEDAPYLRYSIECILKCNRRKVSSDTEPIVVVAPGSFWKRILKAKLEGMVTENFAGRFEVRPVETSVVFSVPGSRAEKPLTRRYSKLEVDWEAVQMQLEAWGHYVDQGKKLRVTLAFSYVQADPQPGGKTGNKTDKRGPTSTTDRMLAVRELRLNAEHTTSGKPSDWQRVYSVMRCPGPPCDLGPHCWVDPTGKKHYKLRSHHLTGLVRYVESGNDLRSQDDVPLTIRQQLYAEEQQRLDRKSNKTTLTDGSSININILPSHGTDRVADSGTYVYSAKAAQFWQPHTAPKLEIEGLQDIAVKDYAKWQQGQVEDPLQKAEI